MIIGDGGTSRGEPPRRASPEMRREGSRPCCSGSSSCSSCCPGGSSCFRRSPKTTRVKVTLSACERYLDVSPKVDDGLSVILESRGAVEEVVGAVFVTGNGQEFERSGVVFVDHDTTTIWNDCQE
jgi:hypothetical protein